MPGLSPQISFDHSDPCLSVLVLCERCFISTIWEEVVKTRIQVFPFLLAGRVGRLRDGWLRDGWLRDGWLRRRGLGITGFEIFHAR